VWCPWGRQLFDCYYVQNAKAAVGKTEFDFDVDPPPNLAIQIDITHRSIPREPIHAALGIQELWRFNGRELQVLT